MLISYTVYPKWFGNRAQAEGAMWELARATAERRGWKVAGLTLSDDGFDERGDRCLAVVDFVTAPAL